MHLNLFESGSSSMTLLDNLTSQLIPERKERFIDLFKQLQVNTKNIKKRREIGGHDHNKLLTFNLYRVILFLQINFWLKQDYY